MTPEEQEESDKKNFYTWIFSLEPIEEELTIKQQIKIANKKRLKAVKRENYLKAAKYRDLITQLKQQNE
jgi:protein-arginine kinase activator protein McsA